MISVSGLFSLLCLSAVSLILCSLRTGSLRNWDSLICPFLPADNNIKICPYQSLALFAVCCSQERGCVLILTPVFSLRTITYPLAFQNNDSSNIIFVIDILGWNVKFFTFLEHTTSRPGGMFCEKVCFSYCHSAINCYFLLLKTRFIY